MWIRNYKGKLVFLDENKFSSEKEFYIELWKLKYNIDIAKKSDMEDILDYIDGEKLFV